MGILKRIRRAPLLLALMLPLFAMPTIGFNDQAPVGLGTTETFAILAGETITNTGPTTITGDVGLHPGTAFTGQADVTLNGALHIADGVALQAKNDLVTAYNDAAGRTPVTRIATELGGKTLTPGVYDSASGTFEITGNLTLDSEGNPNAVFVFKTESTLITASNSRIFPVNGARFCRIFWKVGSSATLGTDSRFVGHIFAYTSITLNTRARVQGQVLAMNGAVTLDTNVITNGICDDLPTPTTSPPTTSPPTTSPPTTSPPTTSPPTTASPSTTDSASTTTSSSPSTPSSTTTSTTASTSTSTTTTTLHGTTSTTAPATTSTTRPSSTTSTTEREEFPNTGMPWYSILLFAVAALVLVGAVGSWKIARR
jgi:hypothetical protein